MAPTLEIPATLKAMLLAAGLTSVPATWSVHSTAGVFSVNLTWSSTPASAEVLCVVPEAPRILTRKTPSMLRRDRRRQEAYRQKKHQVSVSKVEPEVNTEVCGDDTNISMATSTFCEKASQTGTVEKLHKDISIQAMPIPTSDKSVQSVPITCTKNSQTDIELNDGTLEASSNSQTLCATNKVKTTEKVLKRRIKGNNVQYLVSFLNCPQTMNTWIPEEQLDSAAISYIEKNDKNIRGPPIPKKVTQISHVSEEQKGSRVETGSSYSLNNIFLPQQYKENEIDKQAKPNAKCDKLMETKEMIKILSFYPGDHSRYDFVNVLLPGENSEIVPFTQVPKYLFDKAGLSHVYRYMQTQ